MPKANPYGKLAKKVESIRAKAAKLGADLNALSLQIAAEAKKADAAPAKKAAAKPAPAKKAAPAKAPAKKPAAKKAPPAKK